MARGGNHRTQSLPLIQSLPWTFLRGGGRIPSLRCLAVRRPPRRRGEQDRLNLLRSEAAHCSGEDDSERGSAVSDGRERRRSSSYPRRAEPRECPPWNQTG